MKSRFAAPKALVASALVLAGMGCARAALPAFPGAEGFGAYATGGRGGDVYHVVNLNSSGAGSLAYGLNTGVPASGRTIVFDVSGYIHISGELRVTTSKITIAGQTAPGDGIGLKDGTFRVSGDDVVIRFIRFRDGNSADAVNLDSGSINSIFDHCDMMLSNDENMSSFNSPPENVTLQWSINAWGMEPHSAGGLWDQNHATAHHTLWSHNHTRNPKARPNGLLDWINNVTFDWDIGFIMGDSATPASWKANVERNYFLCPPGNTRSVALEKANLDRNGNPNFSLWQTNNLMDNDGDGVLDGTDKGWAIASGSYVKLSNAIARTGGVPVTQDPPLTAYKKILSQAGPLRLDGSASVALRDELDTILIANVMAQRRHHVSSPAGTGAGNGGFGFLNSLPPPPDTDRDGMPDFWESSVGLNAAVDDHNSQVPANAYLPNAPAGYTALEEYLHWLATPHGFALRNAAYDVDLRKFTIGFTNRSPIYTLANATNGSVTLSNGHLARFLPTTNFSGRARFNFTVTDVDGSVWTQTFALLVSPLAPPKSVFWRGDGTTNRWDTLTNANCFNGTALVTFGAGDSVTFDDTGSNAPPVQLAGPLAPGSVTVNADKNYTFGGGGSLGGAMTLQKSGAGTLTISASNTFSGGIKVDDGAVALGSVAAHQFGLGTGTVMLNDGATLTLFDNGSGLPGSGTFPNDLVISGTVALNAPPRGNLGGDVGGSGTLNLFVPFVRADLSGSWSGFAGTINVTGDGDGGDFRSFNTAGFPSAQLNLGERVSAYFAATTPGTGTTNNIGALNGPFTSSLRGGPTGGRTFAWRIGGLNTDSTFLGTVSEQTAGATLGLIKTGSGTLTLGGTNSFTGGLTVSAGKVRVDGITTAGAVNVVGGRLGGSGRVSGPVTLLAGTSLTPGAGTGFPGALTISNGLNLSNATFSCDLSNIPVPASGGVNDLVLLGGGTLTLAGVTTTSINLLNGELAPGTYTLITGGSATVGGAGNLVTTLPAGTRQSFVLSTPPGQMLLHVTNAAGSLVWRGTNGSAWDYAVTTNWLNGANADRFFTFDAVRFDDTATNGSVNIIGSVAPRTVVVSNVTRAYTLGGGALDGATKLVKSGSGTLTLSGSNNFSGGTFLHGGVIALANDTANAFAFGSGAITLNAGTLAMHDDSASYNAGNFNLIVPTGATATFNADGRCDLSGTLTGGGTLNFFTPFVRPTLFGDWSGFTGRLNVTTDAGGGDLRLGTDYVPAGFPSAFVNLAAKANLYFVGTVSSGAGTTVDIGELSGASGSTLLGGATGGRTFRWRIGGLGTSTNFAGNIAEQNSGTITIIEKVGGGAWTLTGSNSYAGATLVSAGALLVNNTNGSATGAGAVTVAGGAKLGGRGTIDGALTMEAGSTLAPGSPAGTLTINDDVVIDDAATLQFALGTPGTNNARVAVAGDLNLGGTLNISNAGGFGPGAYTLFTHGGALQLGAFTLGSAPGGWLYDFDTNIVGQVRLLVATNAPRLAITAQALSWRSDGGVFTLHTTTNLTLPIEWIPATNAVIFTNGEWRAALATATNGSRFYRLQSQ